MSAALGFTASYGSQVAPAHISKPPGGSEIVRYDWYFPKDGNPGVNIGYDSKNTPRYVAGVWNYIPTALTTPNR